MVDAKIGQKVPTVNLEKINLELSKSKTKLASREWDYADFVCALFLILSKLNALEDRKLQSIL